VNFLTPPSDEEEKEELNKKIDHYTECVICKETYPIYKGQEKDQLISTHSCSDTLYNQLKGNIP